jgi:hypothetical protein
MASNTQGIMALPETDEATAPTLALDESYGAAKEGLTAVNPEYTAMYDDAMSKAMPALMAMSDQELDLLLQMIQYLQEHPNEYSTLVQELETEGGLEKGSLPEQYDENFLAVFGAAILEAQRTNADTGGQQAPMQPPMQLAKGGIAEAARMVAKHGRNGDTMLAHITKDEAALLKKHGGVGTRNPRTGLREYGLWSDIKDGVKSIGKGISNAVSSVGGAIKDVLSSSVGRIVATVALAAFIGPAAFGLSGAAGVAAQYGLASAGITALGGGDLKDVVKAGVVGAVTGYGGAALGPAIGGSVGVTNAAGQAALGAGATGVGLSAVQGKSIQDSVKDGLAAAAVAGLTTGATKGFDAQAPVSPADVKANATDSGSQTTAVKPAVDPTPLAQPPAAPPAASNLSTETGINVSSTSPDPLGDFAAKNDAFRNTLAAPVAPPVNTAGVTPPPPAAAEPSWFDRNISPSGIQQQGAVDANKAGLDAIQRVDAEAASRGMTATDAMRNNAYNTAVKAATPGVMATYGPATGIALTGVAALGGFKPNDKEDPETQALKDKLYGTPGIDLINKSPQSYLPQNIPGIQYDARGNIIGGQKWDPYSTVPTEVAGNYIPYTPSAYGNNQPQLFADGGYAGSAFGPTPLTMDQGPMMAQGASPVSMNTPGVPMNLPMGFAMGGMPPQGIASLAQGGYPRRTGQISGPGTPTSDSIPAMLSDGEFVFTEKAVRGIGNGNRRAGAKKMYALMHHLEKNASRG